jgi:DNA-binding transcriptional LysR family regulator
VPTLDQLQVFLAVVETGSFAAAGRRLRRATSVVSYAIANLESQLGIEIFDRKSTRKPQLTDAGRAILADARAIAGGVDELLARSRGLIAGLEAEVSLVVDVMLPTRILVGVLEEFQIEFPSVSLRLHVAALGAVVQLVLDGGATLGVSGPLERRIAALDFAQIGAVKLVPVAAPSHPLARIEGCVPEAAARAQVQLVLTDTSSLTKGQEFAVIGLRTWRLADLGAKHALLLAGIGWGSMPEPMIREDLQAGRLVRLAMNEWDGILYRLQSVHRSDTPPGPAARWLLERLEAAGW